MAISDLDVWRTANLLAKQHGDDAVIFAAQQADALLDSGDLEGQAVWRRVLAAVKELQGRKRTAGDVLN